MRIAYLLATDLSKHPGLKHKIDSQIQRWQVAGNEVYRVHLFDGTIVAPNGALARRPGFSSKVIKASKWQRLKQLSYQYEYVRKALKEIKPDLTYSRYLFPAKNSGQIKVHAGRLVLEINSDDRAEYFQKRFLTGLFNAVFRLKALKQADGLVFVTNELACKAAFSSCIDQRVVIANGVEVSSFEFSGNTGNSIPQLVFIGSPGQSWHGIDKIRYLAKQLPDFGFHIIGPDTEACVKLWGEIPDNIVVHGYLTDDAAQSLIKKMDVGIATLALYRKSMEEACPLKVRQYLAQGLPVIAASVDPDIPNDQRFYLQLPNDEKNVTENLVKIRNFVERVTGDSRIRFSARQYAEKYLAAEKKELKRLEFFEKVIFS